MESRVRIGLDFDNTLACYDGLFFRLALERGLIDQRLPRRKRAVRDHLRKTGREAIWTALQGVAYGERLLEAPPFPGVLPFLETCRRRGWEVCIISHKTRTPACGSEVNLQHAASTWLEHYGLLDRERTGIGAEHVWFEPSRPDKGRRIAAEGCTHFVDDLLEFLREPCFPKNVVRIHFDPSTNVKSAPDILLAGKWSQVERLIEESVTPMTGTRREQIESV